MKKNLFCTILLFLFLSVYSVDAYQQIDENTAVSNQEQQEDLADDSVMALNPEKGVVVRGVTDVLQANHESFFPITIADDSFSKQVDAVLHNIDSDSVMRVVTEYGQQDIDLFVNTDMIHDHVGKINFNRDFPQNFEISADVTVRDVYPKSRGGCYVSFSEKGMTNNADAAEYYFVADGQNVMLYYKTVGSSSGKVFPVGTVSEMPVKISIMHLTGQVFFWVNDVCVGQYHDGKNGSFRLSYGALTYADGETACCSFDNLLIRKVGGK
ncbi:MAG: hypothetical protein II969_09360 [Anaerolineaceae bacterium]|nr:hypothetical protein [Anaerolineaceae bacterium]